MNKILLLLVCNFVMEFSVGARYDVYCGSCIEERQNTSNKCIITRLPHEKYPNTSDETVEKPDAVTHSFYNFKGNSVDNCSDENANELAFNITWVHRGDRFNAVEGYSLAISRTSSEYRRVFEFTIDLNIEPTSKDRVFIHYPCFGTNENEDIRCNEEYSFLLRSLPSYQGNADHQINEVRFSILTSNDFDYYSGSAYYGSATEESGSGDNNDSMDSVDPLVASLAASAAVFCTVSVSLIVCFFCCRFHKKNSSFLLLASVYDEPSGSPYLDAIDAFGSLLKEYGNLPVTSCVWEMSTISNPVDWIAEKLKQCNHIVLICTPLGKHDWENKNTTNLFCMGLENILKEHRQKFLKSMKSHSYSIVYFNDNPAICIPEVVSSHNLSYYSASKRFDFIFHRLTGKKFKRNNVKAEIDEAVARINVSI